MDAFDVLTFLQEKERASECRAVHSVYEGIFREHRGPEVGGTLTVYVENMKSESVPHYSARFVSIDGKKARSNLEYSIESAIAGIHWNELFD